MFEQLLPTPVEVLRQARTRVNGALRLSWVAVAGLRPVVRFDLNFIRPGKGQLPPLQSGVRPDRVGVVFAELSADIRAGDRLRPVSGPVAGTFEVRNIPDVAQGYGAGHHKEIEVIEVAQVGDDSYLDAPITMGPSAIRHLYASTVEVLERVVVDSSTGASQWVVRDEVLDSLQPPGRMRCRLDLGFVRPGKDQLPAPVAGRAVDRIGVLFCDATPNLRAGDRVRCVEGDVTGTFEVRVVPDVAQALAVGHHIEVQVVEVAQSLAGVYPGGSGP